MFTFVKLTRIVGLNFSFNYDTSILMDDIRNDHKALHNVKYILTVNDPIDQTYYVDISKLMTSVTIPASVTDIAELIADYLTPEQIYSYHTEMFLFDNNPKFIQESDSPGGLEVRSFSITRNEESSIYDDPNYPDLRYHCSIDMSRMFPIIDGLIYKSQWIEGNIVVPGKSSIVYTKDTDGFISFQNSADVRTFTLREIIDNGNIIPEIVDGESSYTPIVIFGGRIVHNDELTHSYSYEHRKLKFDSSRIMQEAAFKDNFVDFDTLVDDDNSFVMMVACNNIYKRVVDVVKYKHNNSDYYFGKEDVSSMGFYCIDSISRLTRRFVILPEKYYKAEPGLYTDGLPHHSTLCVERFDSDSMKFKLIQLALV